jgi:hypothetical protein
MIHRPHRCLRAVSDADLVVERLDVSFHGRFADVELARDLLVGGASRQMPKNELFPVGQSYDGVYGGWFLAGELGAGDTPSRLQKVARG